MNERSNKWQIQFNVNKCKALSTGRDNPRNKYTLNREELVSSEYEKDLGVINNSDLRLRKQCKEAIQCRVIRRRMVVVTRAHTSNK